MRPLSTRHQVKERSTRRRTTPPGHRKDRRSRDTSRSKAEEPPYEVTRRQTKGAAVDLKGKMNVRRNPAQKADHNLLPPLHTHLVESPEIQAKHRSQPRSFAGESSTSRDVHISGVIRGGREGQRGRRGTGEREEPSGAGGGHGLAGGKREKERARA